MEVRMVDMALKGEEELSGGCKGDWLSLQGNQGGINQQNVHSDGLINEVLFLGCRAAPR
jgi:hypothetical protein